MPMTEIPGVPSRDQIRAGMAFYTGTGPKNTSCGSCKYFEAYRHHYGRCEMFVTLAGRRGARILDDYRSCKYYETAKRRT